MSHTTKCDYFASRAPELRLRIPRRYYHYKGGLQRCKSIIAKYYFIKEIGFSILNYQCISREILLNMVESGWLKKEGAARSTIYVRNTEKR